MRLLLGGLVVGGIIWATRKASISSTLDVSPEGISLQDVSLTRIMGKVKYRLTNPGNASVTVNDFFAVAQYKGVKIAEISKPEPFTIPGRGSVNVSLEMRVSNINLIPQIFRVIQEIDKTGNVGELKVRLLGGFNANGVPVPFDYVFQVYGS